MKWSALTALLIFGAASAAHAMSQAPPVLLNSVRCLAAKKFLLPANATTLTFGYYLDTSSYPGEEVVYVVQYAAPTGPGGLVFAVFLAKRDNHQEFDIQNNAEFALSSDVPDDVVFKTAPLGGAWTQKHLVAAIKKIQKRSRFAIAIESHPATFSNFSCVAYTDPQPVKNGKK